MSAEQLLKELKEIKKLYETGIIGERDYEYETEHLRMKYYELTAEMPDEDE